MVVKNLFLMLVLAASLPASSQGFDVFKLFGGGSSSAPRPDDRGTERVCVLEKESVSRQAKTVANAGATNTSARAVEKFPESGATNTAARVVEKPVTNVVEKVVYDRSAEKTLRDELDREEKRGDLLEAKNADLAERNEELAAKLEEERGRRERLERIVPKSSRKSTGRPARLTSATTYYDRKEGVAFFDGNVHVDDEQYQLHANRAYVFMDGSNDVRRIVAIGNVAMTNETRRAYAAKASYYKNGGMVVLYSGDGIVAEVRDESKEQDQVVRGRKIKFWIDTEQVQVLEADISAPTGGMGKGGLKGGFNKMMGN